MTDAHQLSMIAPTIRAKAVPKSGEYLAFRLGAEEYGLDIQRIQEIRFYEQPTRIAGSPTHVLGILDLRGTSVPIVDLRTCLGLQARFDEATVTVVINPDAHHIMGAVVDSVSDVIDLQAAQIRDMPCLGEGADTHGITGLACITQEAIERTLLLMDVTQLMAYVRNDAAQAI